MNIKIQYDPKAHGRNAAAIRELNKALRDQPLSKAEAVNRIKQHLFPKRRKHK